MSATATPACEPRFVTIEHVAELTGLSTATIRRAVRDGKLKAHKFGRAVRISHASLTDYLAAAER